MGSFGSTGMSSTSLVPGGPSDIVFGVPRPEGLDQVRQEGGGGGEETQQLHKCIQTITLSM